MVLRNSDFSFLKSVTVTVATFVTGTKKGGRPKESACVVYARCRVAAAFIAAASSRRASNQIRASIIS